MRRRLVIAGVVLACLAPLAVPRVQFLVGGALVNLGYRFQDHLHAYDLRHGEALTAAEVWEEFQRQNGLASAVRHRFPRSTWHPVVAMLVCMDARIDTNELSGDTRRNAYVLRTAGSVMGPEEGDMLELAVNNGVKVVVLTRHTECAAEAVANDPSARAKYPALAQMVDQRPAQWAAFLARPAIAKRIADGELLVKELLIDTSDETLKPLP